MLRLVADRSRGSETVTLRNCKTCESTSGMQLFVDEGYSRIDQDLEVSVVKNPDEPLFTDDDTANESGATVDLAVRERIRRLIDQQPYAVLCVQGGGQPYGALVAFAFSDDLRHAVFVTPMATRKFQLLSECDHVAIVIDDRSDNSDRLMEIQAVTVTGRSKMIDRGREFDQWAELLVTRHPYLQSFVNAATCALFRIDVVRFLHVARFQEVSQWIPGDRS